VSNSSIPIAETPEALTPAWLTDALTRAGHLTDARVVDVALRPLGTGQMSDSLHVTLTYDEPTDAPASLVAKLPAADPTSRATALALRNYEKEVRFYQHLAPGLPMRTPAVFYADIDVTTASFVLLLEDLAPAAPGDQLEGCTPEEAEIAIAELVRLHAPRWDDPALLELDWLHADPEASRQLMAMLMPTLWDGFRERYAADVPPHVHQAGDVLFTHLEAYLTVEDDARTIVHGDYRLDNLLFDATPGGTPIAVVDWQTCTVGSALQDVAYFIGAGLHEGDRRAGEEGLVRRYHASLVGAGVGNYDWDRCWRDYRRGTWAGLLVAVAASMMVERTERGDQMFLTMASRHARHALDLDAPELLTGA
jgi:aminoglycoside/choline kinase family phosphotransferase